MALLDQIGNLFGLGIVPKNNDNKELSGQLSIPIDDEGGLATTASYYGYSIDQNASFKSDIHAIQKYREISLYPEIDQAIQDVVNEAVPMEQETEQVVLNMDKLKLSDELKEEINTEFQNVLELLDYNNSSADIFRRWYIDGRLYYQVIVDKKNLKRGIQDMIMLDAIKTTKVKEVKKKKTPQGVDVIDEVQEYFIYNDQGFVTGQNNQMTGATTAQVTGVKLSPDGIVYVPSGYNDLQNNIVLSYLNKAVRPVNQLRMLEDASVVYFIARAPERRVFYIDVGDLPKMKAEQYLKEIMNKYRNKMVYDASTGSVQDQKKYMSMLEDFWLPRRSSGKTTEITTLPGAQNMQSQMDLIQYFQKKLYQALNIPVTRMQEDASMMGMGRPEEISRDEMKFQKFISRLRMKFAQVFYDTLKIQLILKGICNTEQWEEIKEKIWFEFQADSFYTEFKSLGMMQQRIMMLQQADQYVSRYFSKKHIQKKILNMSDEDIAQMDDEIDAEKDDPTARPPQPPGFAAYDQQEQGGDQGAPQDQGDGQDQQDGQSQDQAQYPFQ